MRLTMTLALACAALAGCVPQPTPATNSTATPVPVASATPTPAAPATKACAITADAMYGAEAAYNVPAHAYVTADAKGVLPATLKATVKPYLTAAYSALKQARLFYAARDAGFCGAVADVTSNADDAGKFIPK